jgi:hypothetical protein
MELIIPPGRGHWLGRIGTPRRATASARTPPANGSQRPGRRAARSRPPRQRASRCFAPSNPPRRLVNHGAHNHHGNGPRDRPRSPPRVRQARSQLSREPATRAFRPRRVRILWIGLPLAAVCLACSTTACSGPAPAEGTLTGHLYGVGGPAPGSPRPWPGTVTLTGPGVHLDVSVGASGAYSVTVPPGTYTVVAHSPLYGGGAGLCQAEGAAVVTIGHSTRADVLCQMS